MAAFLLGEGELMVLATLGDVLSRVEAMDIVDGEVDAVWLQDGTVVRLVTPDGADGAVVVERTGEQDLAGLLAAVDTWDRRTGGPGGVTDLMAWADEQLRREWERRWPRRPAWLARRLHGPLPPRTTRE
jgi:hypothetical protein